MTPRRVFLSPFDVPEGEKDSSASRCFNRCMFCRQENAGAAIRRGVVIHDQARAALSGQIRPDPLNEDADAKVGVAKKLEVHRGPCHPGEKAAEPQPAALQHGETLADHGHVAFVEVAERRRCGFALDTAASHREQ